MPRRRLVAILWSKASPDDKQGGQRHREVTGLINRVHYLDGLLAVSAFLRPNTFGQKFQKNDEFEGLKTAMFWHALSPSRGDPVVKGVAR